MFVAGGVGANGSALNSIEVFDPSKNSWSKFVSLPTARSQAGCAALGNSLLVAGGARHAIYHCSLGGQLYEPMAHGAMPSLRFSQHVGQGLVFIHPTVVMQAPTVATEWISARCGRWTASKAT